MIKSRFTNNALIAVGAIVFGVLVLCVVRPVSAATSEPNEYGITSGDDVALHLSKVRNISIEEARVRAEWQNEAGALNDRLTASFPKGDFGGMWIDKDTDRVKIGVLNESKARGDNRTALVEEVAKSNLDDAVDFVNVTYSYDDLRQAKEWISAASQDLNSETNWPLQVGVTPNTNEVLVHVPEDTANLTPDHRAILSEAKTRYGDMIQTMTYSEMPRNEAECNPLFCNSPLRGGVGIKGSYQRTSTGYDPTVQDYEDGVDCTAGFNVVGNSGTRYVVTAGHCANAGNGWATETYGYNTKRIGPIHNSLHGQNGIDAMIIEIKEATYDWDVMGKVYVRGGTTSVDGYNPPSPNEAYDVTDSGASGGLVGERICVSGAGSSIHQGGSCGAVYEVDVSATVDGITSTNLVRASYCSKTGDSGAPVFRLGKALGIHKGAGTSTTCDANKYYSGMNPIINGFNGNIDIF